MSMYISTYTALLEFNKKNCIHVFIEAAINANLTFFVRDVSLLDILTYLPFPILAFSTPYLCFQLLDKAAAPTTSELNLQHYHW